MSPQTDPCPIWEDTLVELDHTQWVQLKVSGQSCNSPRAGGRFLLKQSGAALLPSLTDRQKANLDYWIYHHNPRYRLFDELPEQGGEPFVLNHAWVEGNLGSHTFDLGSSELQRYAMARGWIETKTVERFSHLGLINLSARIYVETQLGVVSQSRQEFVAMWLAKSMDDVYKDGIVTEIRRS